MKDKKKGGNKNDKSETFHVCSIFITIIFSLFIQLKGENAKDLELQQAGATYNRAQVLRWLDEDSFVVGRWDGSLAIFRKPKPNIEYGPVMEQALLPPSKKGIEMITILNSEMFVTSDGSNCMAVWLKEGERFVFKKNINYSQEFDTANSGAFMPYEEWFISGHTGGFLIIWSMSNTDFTIVKTVDVRSFNPVPSPYPLKNIRSVVVREKNIVISGSEDGDICMVKIPKGKILYRLRYNPDAKRGINDLSLYGDYLLLANCSVGSTDKNLWLYKVFHKKIIPLDSYNLIEDTSREQVFNFCVALAPNGNNLFYIASTEEGLPWLGEVVDSKLTVLSKTKIDYVGGAALDIDLEPWYLAATSYAIRLYTLPDYN